MEKCIWIILSRRKLINKGLRVLKVLAGSRIWKFGNSSLQGTNLDTVLDSRFIWLIRIRIQETQSIIDIVMHLIAGLIKVSKFVPFMTLPALLWTL